MRELLDRGSRVLHHAKGFRVDQEHKLELAQALMLGAAMGLDQQYEKIGVLDRKLDRLKEKYERLAKRLSKYETHDL